MKSLIVGFTLICLAACTGTSMQTVPGRANPAVPAASSDEGARCAALVGAQVDGATIAGAKYVSAGAVLPPFNVPARTGICQVRASISPVPTSTIQMEIWLPAQWNNKMLGLGGSGTSGGMVTSALTFPKPVNDGYVTIATDAGHDNTDQPEWAFKQPERIIDYGYRANHLGAQVAKALIVQYYGTPAKRAYFQGCSNGGRDALMLAQRFPKDYDGIIAGAAANNFVSLMTSFGVYRRAIEKLPPNSLTPKMPLLHDAVLNACDALDGKKDGVVENSRVCQFDPMVLSCKPGQDPKACLSSIEVQTVRTLYQDVRTGSGQLVHHGLPVGSEYLWADWWTKANSTGGDFPPKLFGYFVYDNKNWTMASFDLDKDWAAAMRKLSGALDATDTDVRPFVNGGGKLMMYHGWDDQAVAPENTITYFTAAKKKLGNQADAAQLFMVPGMGHCFDGKGFTSADFVGEMDRWVESGTAPQRIVAEKPANSMVALSGVPAKPLMTRPLCAWPKVARYDGTGSLNDEGSFTCVDDGAGGSTN